MKNIISNLKNLHKASQKITSILDKDKLFNTICRQFAYIAHSKYVLFFSFENYQWNLLTTNAIKNKKTEDALRKVSNILIPEIEKTKKEIIINDTADNKKIKSLFEKDNFPGFIKNIFALPVFAQKNLTGVIISINNKLNEIDAKTNYYLFETLSNQISIALKNIFMIEKEIKDKELSTIGKMAYTILHDINNPLTTIRSCADLMRMEGNKEMQRYAEHISSEFNRIMDMISDLTEFIKKGSSRLNLSPQKLSSIIRDYCRKEKKVFLENKIRMELKLNYNESIRVDKNKIIRIFQNLLSNSKDAMARNGKITITTQKNGNFVEIVVSDTGRGMNKKTKENIFEPFYTNKRKSGLGLGMYIVKQLIQQHNGTIEVESAVRKGTTFTIKLPLDL